MASPNEHLFFGHFSPHNPHLPTLATACLQSNRVLLLLIEVSEMMVVPTRRHRFQQAPTATTCPNVHRHALVSLFLSLLRSFHSFYLSLSLQSRTISFSPSCPSLRVLLIHIQSTDSSIITSIAACSHWHVLVPCSRPSSAITPSGPT